MAKDAGTAKDIATGVTARVATIMAKKQMSATIMEKKHGRAKGNATGVTARVAAITAKKPMSAAIMAKKHGRARDAATARNIATADILNLGIGKRFSTS